MSRAGIEKPLRFSGANIPVTAVAKIMRKDQTFIRQAIIQGILPIGCAFKKENSTQFDIYISPKLLYEYTGWYFDDDIIESSVEDVSEK